MSTDVQELYILRNLNLYVQDGSSNDLPDGFEPVKIGNDYLNKFDSGYKVRRVGFNPQIKEVR